MKTFAINGNWIEDENHPSRSTALQFGTGLFETIRVQNGEPLLWEDHMDRLVSSARALGLDNGLDIPLVEKWTGDLLAGVEMRDCSLKILWTAAAQGGTALFFLRPLPYALEHRTKGLSVTLGDIRRNPYSRITAHKTANYLDNLLERQAAQIQGFDEALLLNVHGLVAEGTASNVFIQKEGLLMTPPLDAGLLPGIQRKNVIRHCLQDDIPLLETPISLEMLQSAEGIYLTNALMGFMPVSNFLGTCYDKDDSLVGRINGLTGIIDVDHSN